MIACFLKKTTSYLVVLISLLALDFFKLNTRYLLAETNKLENKSLNESFYLIDTGDIVQLFVFNSEEISKNYPVLNDGTLNIPIAGRINVRNLTIKQAENLIYESLKNEFIEPQVYMTIVKTRPIRFNVIGEVSKPGLYTVDTKTDLGSPQDSFTVVDAIKEAGGITPESNLKEVKIIRKLPGGNDFKIANLNLVDLLMEGDNSQNPFLLDGDVIKLSKASEDKIFKRQMELNSTNLSTPGEIYVIGQVQNPGMYKIDNNTTLVQSILMAGGPIFETANSKSAELLRVNENGTMTSSKFRLNLNKNSKSEYNPLLKNGDVVRIRRSKVAAVSSTIKTVVSPIVEVIPAYTFYKLVED